MLEPSLALKDAVKRELVFNGKYRKTLMIRKKSQNMKQTTASCSYPWLQPYSAFWFYRLVLADFKFMFVGN